jgi:hypothetical protein
MLNYVILIHGFCVQQAAEEIMAGWSRSLSRLTTIELQKNKKKSVRKLNFLRMSAFFLRRLNASFEA